MPHVSRINLPKKTEIELINSLKIIFRRINKNEEIDKFISSLLTKTERLMLAKRLAVVVMLKEGLEESDIAGALHVTRETVERLKLLSQLHSEGYEVAIKKLQDEKIYKQFKKALISLVRYAGRAAGGYVKPEVFD